MFSIIILCMIVFPQLCHYKILGKATIAHHNRPVDECNANEELKPIDQNLNFDFEFQVRCYIAILNRHHK